MALRMQLGEISVVTLEPPVPEPQSVSDMGTICYNKGEVLP